MIGSLRTAVAAALLLAAGNAWALGLGQIQVKSKRNQPLLAEIPIVSTTPGELAALRATHAQNRPLPYTDIIALRADRRSPPCGTST